MPGINFVIDNARRTGELWFPFDDPTISKDEISLLAFQMQYGEWTELTSISLNNTVDADSLLLFGKALGGGMLPRIRELSIYWSAGADENSMQGFGQAALDGNLFRLDTLSFTDCPNLSDITAKAFGTAAFNGKLPHLHTLVCSQCPKVTDESTNLFFNAVLNGKLPHLHSINFSRCPGVTDKSSIILGHAIESGLLPATKILGFSECPKVSDQTVTQIAKAANAGLISHLEAIACNGCPRVTDVSIQILARAFEDNKLEELKRIFFYETGIRSVDASVLRGSIPSDIFNAVLHGEVLRLVKICFVGMGGVGKTSLFHPLFLGEPLVEPPGKTHDINQWRTADKVWKPSPTYIQDEGSVEFEPVVWDFGGQWVLHALHEDYLMHDPRALYILVLSAVRPLQGRIAEGARDEEGNQYDAWINTLANYTGPESPVVIAITQSDKRLDGELLECNEPLESGGKRLFLDFTCDELSSRAPRVVNRFGELVRGVDIKEVVKGCSSRQQVPALREAIESAMSSIEYLWEAKVDKGFQPLIDRVEHEWQTRGTATMQDFAQWCDESAASVNSDDDDVYLVSPESRLASLRSLGVIFYYGETKLDRDRHLDHSPGEWVRRQQRQTKTATAALQNTIFNPHWIKYPLYEVITQSQMRKPKWSGDELNRLLNDSLYDCEMHRKLGHVDNACGLLRDVLLQTGLCFHRQMSGEEDCFYFPRGLHLTPLGLRDKYPNENADFHAKWQWPLLREHAFHRFIVDQLNTEVVAETPNGEFRVWRYGVVIEVGEVQAVLEMDPVKSSIDIWLYGESRPCEIEYHAIKRQLELLAGSLEDSVEPEFSRARESPDQPTVHGPGNQSADSGQAEPLLPSEALQQLQRTEQLAYAQWAYAIEKIGECTDKDAYEWLKENLQDSPCEDLAASSLATFESWSRYLRTARKQTGQTKNSPRAGREHGGSIRKPDEIE